MRDDAAVSLGQGTLLYQALTNRLQSDLDHPDPHHRRQLIDRLVSVYRTAQDVKIGAPAEELVAFSRDKLPVVMKRQVNDYQGTIGRIAQAVYELAGPREGLAFVIRSIQSEPRWFTYSGQDGWSEHWYRLSQWRKEVPDLSDLEEPLLAIVTNELRRDLESRESRSRVIYWQHHAHFWEAKSAVFTRTAETVYAQRKTSGEAVKYIAQYLANGLGNYPRAIDMLAAAVRETSLDASGQSQLAEYLHHEQRFEESILVLEPLVERVPENIAYRTLLMRAYYQTRRNRELLKLLEQTDQYLHEVNRWTEETISQLAASCLDNHLYEQSVKYYTELIPLHKRLQPDRARVTARFPRIVNRWREPMPGWGIPPRRWMLPARRLSAGDRGNNSEKTRWSHSGRYCVSHAISAHTSGNLTRRWRKPGSTSRLSARRLA